MNDWTYYTGDPCYVIDDARWHEFCNALWAVEADNKRKRGRRTEGPPMVPWTNKDGSFKGFVECWDSPGGDATWHFGSTGKMPVDAGLLAIVPRELCEEPNDPAKMGIVHKYEPTLETTNCYDCAPVTLNGLDCIWDDPDDYDEDEDDW